MTRIYLDNAATTAIEPEVWAQVQPYFTEHFGNAASIHSFGQFTKNILEEARERVATVLGASPAEIFFTSSGTEANNFALKGFAFAMMRAKKPFSFLLAHALNIKPCSKVLRGLKVSLMHQCTLLSMMLAAYSTLTV